LALADLNGDSHLDVVVAYDLATTMSVLINDGQGRFAGHVDYQTGPGLYPWSVAVGDVDGDGDVDIVVGSQCDFSHCAHSTVGLFLNQGDGTFAPKLDYGSFVNITSVALGDVNGDDKLDLVAATDQVSVFVNTGDGKIAPPVNYPSSGALASVVLADLRGDGRPEVVVPTPTA
jgi:hypothetical protein